MPRMRTIGETMNFIKENDPDTCLTPFALRRMVLEGAIPSVQTGKKYLLDSDQLSGYLSGTYVKQELPGKIRPISEKIKRWTAPTVQSEAIHPNKQPI